jgi:hypothetical protein
VQELDLQRRVVNLVNGTGNGFAHKMSHRFLVGVPDLLVKISGPRAYPAMLIEVKKDERPKVQHTVTLDVTKQQERFLLRAARSGVLCGVMSFLYQERPRRLWVGLFPIKQVVKQKRIMALSGYVQVDDDVLMLPVLYNFGEHYDR